MACAHTLMQWAIGQKPNAAGVRKTRFLVVRNTVDQLRSTTLKTIVDWFPPSVFGQYRATEKTLVYRLSLADGTQVETEWMLIALDTPDDVRKALSLECTGLWGNECRELHPEVVDGLLMRVNRFPSKKDGGVTRAGAIFDTNMPGEETWWESKMTDPPENWAVFVQPPAVLPLPEWISKFKRDPAPEIVAKSADGDVFVVDPTADNVDNLEPDYYPMTLAGKSADFISVYLRCQYGRTLSGLPVYDKTFQAHKHISKVPLEVIRSEQYPLCIGLDFGRTPAAAVMQLTPRGRVNILSELTSENMGIQTFVQTLLKPHLFAKYPGMPHYLACDPAAWQKTQLGEISPADYLDSAGFVLVRPATNATKRRIEAVEAVLAQSADGEPRLAIDPGCRKIILGFRGGYKWKVTRTGELAEANEPIKNALSHVREAVQYGLMTIDGGHRGARKERRRDVIKAQAGGWT